MTSSPVRESFRLSRSLEYLTEAELTKQIGHSRESWPLVVAKELIDNGLDSAEEIGVAPEITLVVTDTEITVIDNGAGIETPTIEGMLDFDVRESSREVYRSLTRGRQGNAAKCILAVPFVLSDGDPGDVVIEARGTRHVIRVAVDTLAQKPRIEYRTEPGKVHSGTRVTVPFASTINEVTEARFVLLAFSFAALNAHLSLTFKTAGKTYSFHPTDPERQKWTAARPDPPSWYDYPAFERLVGACLAKDRENGVDRPLGEFLQQFEGLKRSAKRKVVTDTAGLTRKGLSCLLNGDGLDRDRVSALLAAMQEHTRPPNPQALGCMGQEHASRAIAEDIEITGEVQYKQIRGMCRGVPYVIEAAFARRADSTDDRLIFSGCNFSPAIERPVVRDLDWLLERNRVDEDAPVVVLFHLVTPAAKITDHGKSVVSIPEELGIECRKVIEAVTADWCREQKRKEREQDRAERRRANTQPKDTTLRDAVFWVIEQAVAETSDHGRIAFSARDLYYSVRPLIQAHTSAELSQKYFETIIDQWEKAYGLIDGRLRDPRGYLREPHTGKVVPLGTKAVDDYAIPLHLYHTIVYFEKKGLEARVGSIPEKYDCAVMASEGFAVRAAKSLLQAAQQGHKIKVLCFHDADPAGYNIFRTLSRSSGAHRFNIQVIDAGLHLEEAIEMGLQTETFTRKKALPKQLQLTDIEREYFTGTHHYNEWRGCRRVELNALSADPRRFQQWVESKLKQHGVARKLVPKATVINQEAVVVRYSEVHRRVSDLLDQLLDLDRVIADVVDGIITDINSGGLHPDIKTWARGLPAQHWRDQVRRLIEQRVDARGADIVVAVRAAVRGIADQLKEGRR